MNVSIAELYIHNIFFAEEANKTIGKSAVGKNALKILQNRRNVTDKVTVRGGKLLESLAAKLQKITGNPVTFKWDIYCGCSCPCSPGYRVIMELSDENRYASLRGDDRINIYLDEDGKLQVEQPKQDYKLIKVLPYAKVKKILKLNENVLK